MKYYLGGNGQKSMEGEFIDLLSSIHDIILFVIIFNIEFFFKLHYVAFISTQIPSKLLLWTTTNKGLV
jgi:hypothetical protein